MFDLKSATEDDRKVTCRTCLQAMGRRVKSTLDWKEVTP
jgi:hypothetical protein